MGGVICLLTNPRLERLEEHSFSTGKVQLHFACDETFQKITWFFITFGQALSRITNGTKPQRSKNNHK